MPLIRLSVAPVDAEEFAVVAAQEEREVALVLQKLEYSVPDRVNEYGRHHARHTPQII